MHRLARATVAGFACCVLMAAGTLPRTALGAPPWAASQTIVAMKDCEGGGQVAFSPGGVGALLDHCGNTAMLRGDGTFGAPLAVGLDPKLELPFRPQRLALYGRARAIYGGVVYKRERFAGTAFVFGPIGQRVSSVQRPQSPSGFTFAFVRSLVSNARGDAAAIVTYTPNGKAWADAGAKEYLYVRRPRGQFVRAAALTGVGNGVDVAVNSGGDVLAVWQDGNSIRVRTVSAAGRLGSAQRLGEAAAGSAGQPYCVASASLDATRRALVAWECTPRDAAGTTQWGKRTMSSAYASPGRPFGKARLVQSDTAPADAGGSINVFARLLRDSGLLVWQGSAGGRLVTRAADLVQGRVENAVTIPGQPEAVNAELQDLAIGPRGGALVAWWSGTSLVAAQRSPGERAFRPPEIVATTPPFSRPGIASAAIDPVTTRAVVVWNEVAGEAGSLLSSTRPAS